MQATRKEKLHLLAVGCASLGIGTLVTALWAATLEQAITIPTAIGIMGVDAMLTTTAFLALLFLTDTS